MIAAGRRRWVGAAAAVLAASLPAWADAESVLAAPRRAPAGAETTWYRLHLDGVPCGRMRVDRNREGDRLRIREATEMTVSRDGQEVRIALTLQTTERDSGELLEASRRLAGGVEPVETLWLVGTDTITETRSQGPRRETRQIPLERDESVLAPEAADRFFAARRLAGADRASWRAISFEQGFQFVDVVATRLGEGTFPWQGREVPVERWRLESSGSPLPTEEWWSRDGRLVESRVQTGLGMLVARWSTAEEARNWRRGELPDVIAASVVALEGRLPRQDVDLELRVRSTSAADLPDLPSTPTQRWSVIETPGEARVGRLEIRRSGPGFEVEPIAPEPSHLAAGPLIETGDEIVRRLAIEDAGIDPDASPAIRAEQARRFVRSWIRRKDLSVGLEGAAAVARSRRGDCTEHATLLAALLRIHGVPCRIAVGLVHAERFAGRRNVFAWHVWPQGWIDGRWVDLDATVAGPRDGIRLAVDFSDLSDGAFDPIWTSTLPLMGAIEIEVVQRGPVADPSTEQAGEASESLP